MFHIPIAVEYWLVVDCNQQELMGMSRVFDYWSLLCTTDDNKIQISKEWNQLTELNNCLSSSVNGWNSESFDDILLYDCVELSREQWVYIDFSVLLFFYDSNGDCLEWIMLSGMQTNRNSFFSLERIFFYWKLGLNNSNTTIIRIFIWRIIIQRNLFGCLFFFRWFPSKWPFHIFVDIRTLRSCSMSIQYTGNSRCHRCSLCWCCWCWRIRCSKQCRRRNWWNSNRWTLPFWSSYGTTIWNFHQLYTS